MDGWFLFCKNACKFSQMVTIYLIGMVCYMHCFVEYPLAFKSSISIDMHSSLIGHCKWVSLSAFLPRWCLLACNISDGAVDFTIYSTIRWVLISFVFTVVASCLRRTYACNKLLFLVSFYLAAEIKAEPSNEEVNEQDGKFLSQTDVYMVSGTLFKSRSNPHIFVQHYWIFCRFHMFSLLSSIVSVRFFFFLCKSFENFILCASYAEFVLCLRAIHWQPTRFGAVQWVTWQKFWFA